MESAEAIYRRLVEPMKARMMRTVYRIVRTPDDIEDVYQDALAQIWKRIRRIDRHPNPQAYILRVCVSVSYDFLRKRLRREKREIRMATENLPAVSVVHPPAFADIDLANRALDALTQLAPKQAQTFFMCEVEGLSTAEVAQALGRSESGVRANLAIAKTKLRKILSQSEEPA